MPAEAASRSEGKRYVLRLFVAGNAPNSRMAKANLERFCERLAGADVEIQVIDVLVDPQAAVEQGVFLTPALQILEPRPGRLVYGNLSDDDVLGSVLA